MMMMEQEEGSLRDLMNLRETLQQAIANIPALSPPHNSGATMSAIIVDSKGQKETASDAPGLVSDSSIAELNDDVDDDDLPNHVSTPNQLLLLPVSHNQVLEMSPSSGFTIPDAVMEGFDLAPLIQAIKGLIKDRPLAKLIPSCPKAQDAGYLRISYIAMQAPWALSLREPYPPPLEVEHKFIRSRYPGREEEIGFELNTQQRVELQLFWYQERITQYVDKQQVWDNF